MHVKQVPCERVRDVGGASAEPSIVARNIPRPPLGATPPRLGVQVTLLAIRGLALATFGPYASPSVGA